MNKDINRCPLNNLKEPPIIDENSLNISKEEKDIKYEIISNSFIFSIILTLLFGIIFVIQISRKINNIKNNWILFMVLFIIFFISSIILMILKNKRKRV